MSMLQDQYGTRTTPRCNGHLNFTSLDTVLDHNPAWDGLRETVHEVCDGMRLHPTKVCTCTPSTCCVMHALSTRCCIMGGLQMLGTPHLFLTWHWLESQPCGCRCALLNTICQISCRAWSFAVLGSKWQGCHGGDARLCPLS